MSGAKSLLDVAKAMQETEKKGEAPGTLTLADVAREQEQAKVSAGMTLMDVARQQQGRASGETAAAAVDKPALLSTLARQIDAEDSARVASAIVATASEVKSAQQEAQRAAVTQSIRQVAEQEESAAAVLQSAVTASREADSNNADDGDGYSSFEEDDAVSSKKQAREKSKREQPTGEDSDGDADGGDERAGPERTTPSDSKESKEFLRAVFRADKSRIRELLDSGDVDANAADQIQHGWSALHWAASQTHTDVLSSLLSRGARVNLVDHMNGWSPLHVAAVRGAVGCAKLLLAAGADASLVDLYGDSPADIAAGARGKTPGQLLELLHAPTRRQ